MSKKRREIARWAMVERNGKRVWKGYCEGDRDFVELREGEPLVCKPEDFATGTVVVFKAFPED